MINNRAPFDFSLIVSMIMSLLLFVLWTENYGDVNVSISQSFCSSFWIIRTEKKVFLLGITQSLFEGVMYTFVLLWTPALSRAFVDTSIPHGIVFSSFMISIMIGSFLYTEMSRRNYQPESFLR